jgi:flagellar basal-body rod protein FlgC
MQIEMSPNSNRSRWTGGVNMSMNQILSGMDISASGLTGERLRMEVAANNIANQHSTRTAQGGPYQRQQVTFASAAG